MRSSNLAFHVLAAIGVSVILSAPAFGAPSGDRVKCESWLNAHYRSHSRTQVVWEYTQDSMYSFRANYRVVTSIGATETIGYDCTINLRSGKMISSPSIDPYEKQKKVKNSSGSLEQHRVKYGKDACPSMSQFKPFVDAISSGNYSYDLPSSCSWLDRGQVVLGPIKTVEYKGYEFALIALPNGQKRWIDASSIFDD